MQRGHRLDDVVRGMEACRRYIAAPLTHLRIARGISSVVERLLSMHEVVGSIPTFSTFFAASILSPPLAFGLGPCGGDDRH